MEIRMDSSALLAVFWTIATLIGLWCFGGWYDRQIERWKSEHVDDGYVALEVVIGVAVTVVASFPLIAIAVYLIPHGLWQAAVIILTQVVCFAASGIPMIRGDLRRTAQARRNDLNSARSGE